MPADNRKYKPVCPVMNYPEQYQRYLKKDICHRVFLQYTNTPSFVDNSMLYTSCKHDIHLIHTPAYSSIIHLLCTHMHTLLHICCIIMEFFFIITFNIKFAPNSIPKKSSVETQVYVGYRNTPCITLLLLHEEYQQ